MQNQHPPHSHALLITACIAPKPEVASLLRISDPTIRLRDYENTLRFWLRHSDSRVGAIVFADNSGHPLDNLRAIAEQEAPRHLAIEFHSYNYPAPSPGISYGYPEICMINDTLATSPALRRLPWFVKATGRYRYPDFSKLLDRLPIGYKVATDTTGRYPQPWRQRSNPISNFALVFFKTDFYLRHLADIPDRMRPAPPWNRRQFVESMLYDALLPMSGEPGIVMRWPRNCEPLGIGANGMDYSSRRRKCVAMFRAILRATMPHVWI